MRRSADFSDTVRIGNHSGRPRLVLHYRAPTPGEPASPPRVGVIVSKAVGGAVVRNGVKRRLRHQLAARLSWIPGGAMIVVRARPAAASASSRTLGEDLEHCLGRLKVLATEQAPT
jgi:ribonuclease P protein component